MMGMSLVTLRSWSHRNRPSSSGPGSPACSGITRTLRRFRSLEHRLRSASPAQREARGRRPGPTRGADYNPAPAPRSCTPSLTITPGSPTSKSATTRKPEPRSECSVEPWHGSPPTASSSSECAQTTATATARRLARRLRRPRHQPQADPGATDPKPTTNGTLPPHPRRRLAYAGFYDTEVQRRAVLPACIYLYNHHRAH
jgi:hypothetical protein